MRWWWAPAGLFAWLGCSVSIDFEGTRYLCPDMRCPGGFECVGGECVPAAGGDGAAGSDGGGVDGGPVERCGTVTLLADDFEDGLRSDDWGESFEQDGTGLIEANGELTIELASSATGDHYAGYESSDFYDLRDARVSVQAVQPPNLQTSAEMALAVGYDGADDAVLIQVTNDQLQAIQVVGGTSMSVRSRTFNPNPHRYWAIRESAGTLYWETSGDGQTWGAQEEMPTPFDMEFVRVTLAAGTSEPVGSPGQAVFDDFNGGTPRGRRCPVSSLVDGFDEAQRGRAWARSAASGACTATQAGGAVTIGLSDTAIGACLYGSSSRYDLEGDAVTLEVSQATAGIAQTLFILADRSGVEVMFLVEAGMLIARREDEMGGWENLSQVAYDPAAHRLWRFREEAGTVHWETAPSSGEIFTTLHSAAAPLDHRAVMVGFGADTYTITPAPGSARFERINGN